MNLFALAFLSIVKTDTALGGSLPPEMLNRDKGETHEFQAKISRVMNLFINSLYTNEEIFVRELLSNASDALAKIRTKALLDKTVSADKLEIAIEIDTKNKALVIRDNGIGMTKEELKKNLGTIAESGTTEFLKKVDEGKDISTLIGQFGVGFYSAFLVSERIVVASRSCTGGKQHIWDCDASASSYSVYEDPRGETLACGGTEISLYLKKKAQEFLKPERIKEVVKKYGEFYQFPVYLRYEKEVQQEPKEDGKDAGTEGQSTITRIEVQSELLNANKPIWDRDPSEVSEEEYKTFYKTLTGDKSEPAAWKHFRIEGNVEFTGIMFVPKSSTYNPYKGQDGEDVSLSLHVKHVFITNKAELLPRQLSFVRGVVDSSSLPLNVSREVLQNNRALKIIRKRLIGKVAEMLEDLAEDTKKYEQFYETHGGNIRSFVYQEPENTRFVSFLRFYSSLHPTEKVSLDRYVECMKKDQKGIFYLAGETLPKIKKSAYIEGLLEKEYPVLYLNDPLDEPTVLSLQKYKAIPFEDTSKEGLSIDQADQDHKQLEEKFQPLSEWILKMFVDTIDKVCITQRLTKSSCAVVAKKGSWSPNMERVVSGQAGASADKMAAFYRTQKKIFEINPAHPLIACLSERVCAKKASKNDAKCMRILYDTALVRSGMPVRNTNAFSANVELMLENVLGLKNAQAAVDYEEEDLSKRKDLERRKKYEEDKLKYEKEREEKEKEEKEKKEKPDL